MVDNSSTASGGGTRRARRRRRPGTSPPAASPEPQSDATDTAGGPSARRGGRRARGEATSGTDRGLRDLVGAGPSQLGVSGALRGRDVDRPSDDDLAEAERDVVIIRRHWRPPTS